LLLTYLAILKPKPRDGQQALSNHITTNKCLSILESSSELHNISCKTLEDVYRNHTGVNGYGSIFLKTVAQQAVRHGAPESEDGEFFIVTSMPSNYTKALVKL
jgi:hypothetical protein